MTRVRSVVIVSASALAGAIVGGAIVGWALTMFFESGYISRSSLAVIVQGKALERISQGQADEAVRVLNRSLDWELLYLASEVEMGHEPIPNLVKAVDNIDQTRRQSGYEPSASPEAVQQAIQSILSAPQAVSRQSPN
jgi:hypothetical protein